MKLLKIIKYPDKKLFLKSKQVMDMDNNTKELIEDMKFTMLSNKGVGIAAPQVGENIRIIIVMEKNNAITMINPEIETYGQMTADTEGCLSCPGVNKKIERYNTIEVSYYDEEMQQKKRFETGMISRIIQHEIDHLNGKMIIEI